MEQSDFQVYERDGWFYAPHIPVFDQHERDGVLFDDARLSRIADNCNKRIADTGDEVPLVPGHSPEGRPEEDIEVLGWASNFTVGMWGREKPRACIFADLKFPAEKWETARNLPRRSVELWDWKSPEAFIDPIALLGATTPHRDLGLLYARKNQRGIDTYLYELSGGRMEKDELVKCFAEMLEESDIGKYVRNQMHGGDEEKVEAEHEEEKPSDEKAEADHGDEKPADDEDNEKLKNQRDQERRKYARLEAEHKLLAGRLAELERKERVSTRKADLLGIEAEGVLFDMAEELETVADLDDKSYARHLDKMRKRYSRAPIGVRVQVAAIPEHGSNFKNEITQEQVRAAAELVLSGKAKTTDEALNMVKGV